jgi:hypothetical protein
MPEIITKENDNPPVGAKTPLIKKFSKKTILIAAGVLSMLFVVTLVLLLSNNSITGTNDDPNQQNSKSQSQNSQVSEQDRKKVLESISSVSNTLVYGTWREQKSIITSIDLLTSTSTELAVLPSSIKNINVLTPQQLIYIDQTDDNDHGKQIAVYQIRDKKIGTTIKASPGFGIDDFILSPNKEYMAIWEVSMKPGTNVLQGGRSRVYGVRLSQPGIKHLLFDEAANGPVHYPRAVLDNGRVFADRFQPNDPAGGAGWSYGMSVADYNGANKREVTSMQNGTYGTQPSLSPDGRHLVFAGYDGSQGDGKKITNGFRQSLLTPTTVELLDTETLERRRLPKLSNADIYTSAEWGASSNEILVFVISKKENVTGLYAYDISKQTLSLVNIPDSNDTTYSLVAKLSANKMIIGKAEDSASSLGNLGDEYMQSLTKIYYYDASTNHAVEIPMQDVYAQYITTLPSKYFERVLGMKAHAQGGNPEQPNVTVIDLYSDKPSKENLQLKTFLLKPSLNIKREEQQTKPIPTPTPTIPKGTTPFPTRRPFVIPKTINCRDLAKEQCGKSWMARDCVERRRKQLKAEGKCNQSPLYLYGTEGTNVKVEVLTTVYNDNPLYGTGYSVTLLENGSMLIGGKSYQAINYDYQSNLRKLTAPTRGTIAKRKDLEKVLKEYAGKLGLNEKETADLVKVGKEKTASPYVFISFFDQQTSERILPLSFAPKPDNYLNVVFYFKQISEAPNYSPEKPAFPTPINRSGFTAVEVSEIIE